MIHNKSNPFHERVVRPILEYAIQAVSPCLQKDIGVTERPEELATRLVKGLWHFPYERRLEILGLPSLAHLPLRADLVLPFLSALPNRGTSCRSELLILPRKKFSNAVLMVFGTPCLLPNPPWTSN